MFVYCEYKYHERAIMDYQVLFKTEMNIPASCVLAGHSPEKIRWDCRYSASAAEMDKKISSLLEKLIKEKGVVHFITGMTRGAGLLCAQSVIRLKKKYPFISLQCVIPDNEYLRDWSADDRALFRRITDKADSILCISDVPIRYGKKMRREFMVDAAMYLICVYRHGTPGPVADMIEYAMNKDRRIITIDPDDCRIFSSFTGRRSG